MIFDKIGIKTIENKSVTQFHTIIRYVNHAIQATA